MTRLCCLLALLAVAACAPVVAVDPPPAPAPPAATERGGAAYTLSAADEAFLDTLQHRTFRWFWETTPENGLVHDRWPGQDFSSIAAIGFALPAYGIGAERGYVTRAEAADRTLTTLRTLFEAPQGPEQVGTAGFRGYFYHFLEYYDATRFRNTELSTIDTALLMAGVLFSREYFDGAGATERSIRATADSLYQRVEWEWFRKPGDTRLSMGWYPEADYTRADWRGYNEAMILYLLGLGSPTHALDADVWPTWTDTYKWEDFYGYEHVNFTPLFGHQYSHLFVDFRGIQDEWMRDRSARLGEPYDYFENSRRGTLSQQAYAADNPGGWTGYSAEVWGLTASDGPGGVTREVNGEERRFHSYWARGASADHVNDDGTLAPTALGGSIPFAPEITIPALRTIAERYPDVWTDDYGFRDAFNPSFTFDDANIKRLSEVGPQGWVDQEYLGIDQGPILIMAENYRTGLVWETLKRSPYLVRGLQRAGFQGGWLDAAPQTSAETVLDLPPSATDEREPSDRLLVVVLGSSTAEGTGPTDRDSTWVNRYRDYLETVDPRFDVLNLARGGYSTFHLAPAGTVAPERIQGAPDPMRNIDAALARDPVAIVINLPSNDAAYEVDTATQLANFDAILSRADAAGVPVWITTTQPRALGPEWIRVQEEVRDAIFDRYGDRAIDFWTGFDDGAGAQAERWDAGDDIHYNDAAHRIFFERVRDAGLAESVLSDR